MRARGSQRGFPSRSVAAALMAATLLPGAPARADDHLVQAAARDERLVALANQHDQDVSTLTRLLEGQAAGPARAMGVDVRRIASALPLLSDGELRDLARRAEALDQDPAAGDQHLSHTGLTRTGKIVVILMIVLVIIVGTISASHIQISV